MEASKGGGSLYRAYRGKRAGVYEPKSSSLLVPVTTRSVDQYRRIRWPGSREPDLAVTTNGAILLEPRADQGDDTIFPGLHDGTGDKTIFPCLHDESGDKTILSCLRMEWAGPCREIRDLIFP